MDYNHVILLQGRESTFITDYVNPLTMIVLNQMLEVAEHTE